jgi:L-ascorbate metabolism protein UlaG (beta-lactamase superfamily)
LEISWLGHSCLKIRSGDSTLITDPYDDSLGHSMGRPRADIVTSSHRHPHHSYFAGIEGSPRLVRGPGEYEIGNFYVTGIGTERGDGEGEPLINTVFSIQVEGLTLCHLGDLDRALSSRQVEWASRADILCVPSGGVCTMDAIQVAELVGLLGPKIVVPMHYKAEGVTVDLLPLDSFLEALGVTEPALESRIDVTATNLPRELRLVVLRRAS